LDKETIKKIIPIGLIINGDCFEVFIFDIWWIDYGAFLDRRRGRKEVYSQQKIMFFITNIKN
jgi:hypothetical protein